MGERMERIISRINRKIIRGILVFILILTACGGSTSTWQEEIDACVQENRDGVCYSLAGLAIHLKCGLEAYSPMMQMYYADVPFEQVVAIMRTEGLCPDAPQENTG
jgi:hypothetical protein